MKKRITALLLAVVMVLALAACGGDSSGNNSSNGNNNNSSVNGNTNNNNTGNGGDTQAEFTGVKEVVVGVSADIKTWDPWGTFNIGRQNLAPIVYQALTAYVPNFETNEMDEYFVMAESYEKTSDDTYTIKIRPGIVDTAGNPFTAEDAVFSYNKCKEVSTLAQVKPIVNMEVIDELTFTMTLSRETVGSFQDILAAINMVTQEAYEAAEASTAEGEQVMATAPVGTSPMVLADYQIGSQAVFTRAGSYWNQDANDNKDLAAGYCSMWDFNGLDKITYKFISDTNAMAIALENGDIDIARAIGDEDVSLLSSEGFTTFGYPEGNYAIAFNVSENSPLQNYNLRMAIALCLDSEAALDTVSGGDGEIATCWSYKTFNDYQDEWTGRDYFNYDLTAAKEYLSKWEAESGQSASGLQLKLMYQAETIADSTAEYVQYAIGALTGNPLTLELVSYDRATFTASKKDPAAADMSIVNGQVISRTDSCYNWDNNANTDVLGFNIFHDYSGELDKAVMDAISVNTHGDATVLAFQKFIDDNCYMKNLFYTNEYGAAADWIGNLEEANGAKICLNLGALEYDWANSGK